MRGRSILLLGMAVVLGGCGGRGGARYWGSVGGPNYSGATMQGNLPLAVSFANTGPAVPDLVVAFNRSRALRPIRITGRVVGPGVSYVAKARPASVDAKHWVWAFGPIPTGYRIHITLLNRFVRVPRWLSASARFYANVAPHGFGYSLGGGAFTVPFGG